MFYVRSDMRQFQPGVMDLEQVPNNLGTACLRLDTGAPITVSARVSTLVSRCFAQLQLLTCIMLWETSVLCHCSVWRP